MPYQYPWGTSSYYYDYPAGYYRASQGIEDLSAMAGGILGNVDTGKLIKAGVAAAAMWFLFPKEKGMGKILKVGGLSAAYYFLG